MRRETSEGSSDAQVELRRWDSTTARKCFCRVGYTVRGNLASCRLLRASPASRAQLTPAEPAPNGCDAS